MTIWLSPKGACVVTFAPLLLADLATLAVWGINCRSQDMASKSHSESQNLEIATIQAV